MIGWDWQLDGWIVIVGLLAAGACALPGCYLVLRRMSLMGDAISHAVLPGLAAAFLLSNSRAAWPMFFGAVIVGVLTSLLSETIRRYGRVEHGAAMGVVFSVLFAIGLIMIRQVDHVDLDPGCVLYGNIVQVGLDAIGGGVPQVAQFLGVVFVMNLLFVLLFYKELKITTFDPELATTLGINATLMHYALMVIVAVTTVACFEAVGSILVIAMLIVPAAAAHLLTDRLGLMLLFSLAIAFASAILGHVFALYGPRWIGLDPQISVNTAAMMAVVAGALLGLAVFLSPQYGLVSKLWHRLQLSLQIAREDILGLLYRYHERGGDPAHRMPLHDLVGFFRDRLLPRWAITGLVRRGLVHRERSDAGVLVSLTESGLREATQLVRTHRLWEAYLDRHFNLPLDHLHMPAERVEHYITSDMHERLEADLTEPSHDPHGRRIPDRPS